ncbi:hypothetical protein F2Q65_06905 [Thiohalocapsa marina]|uniref:Sulfotransferase n=1 Tax=Thiohalocapsa marina TaxID=424902 RepID=A0A5M8FRG8_9GAMM|nr:hypothetical protein [Thiohalocapsa marina]KAA6186081.1 hypothetical protein F2Q65_06905 [Thiohalocapsa marina]
MIRTSRTIVARLLGLWPTRTRRTFVVLGCPRGGTSLLAGALDAAGVYMGKYRTLQYEDPEFKIQPHLASEAPEQLAPVIRARNLTHRYWGWKFPNNIYYIERVLPLLINPCFLFVYRDLYEIARSSARHDGRNWTAQGEHLIEVAFNHSAKVRRFQASLHLPHHVFQLEAIQADPGAFADQMVEILHPMFASREKIMRFVMPHGGYHAHGAVKRHVIKN